MEYSALMVILTNSIHISTSKYRIKKKGCPKLKTNSSSTKTCFMREEDQKDIFLLIRNKQNQDHLILIKELVRQEVKAVSLKTQKTLTLTL